MLLNCSMSQWFGVTTMYFIGRVTLFFANNSLTEYRITIEILHNFFRPWRNYASPTSGKAYRDRRLTINFELWVEIFCVPTCFHVRIPNPCLSVCLSVCPHPEKRNHHSFVNMSPTIVIDTSMERSSRVLHHGNPKIWFFFKKVRNSNFDEELKPP